MMQAIGIAIAIVTSIPTTITIITTMITAKVFLDQIVAGNCLRREEWLSRRIWKS